MSGALHEESQSLVWWAQIILLVCVGISLATVLMMPPDTGRWWVIIPIVLLIGVYGVFTPMRVEVSSERIEVRFGHFGWPRWIFPIGEIDGARVVSFRPLRDYGGWGIRNGEDGYCLNERGNRGVRFEHVGKTYTIGSDAPEQLLAALRTVGADIEEA